MSPQILLTAVRSLPAIFHQLIAIAASSSNNFSTVDLPVFLMFINILGLHTVYFLFVLKCHLSIKRFIIYWISKYYLTRRTLRFVERCYILLLRKERLLCIHLCTNIYDITIIFNKIKKLYVVSSHRSS